MLIYEIVQRKKYLQHKLKDLNNYLVELNSLSVTNKSKLYNEFIKVKFELLNKLRSHIILLREQNRLNFITIEDKSLSVEEALFLRNTLKSKVVLLDDIIFNGDKTVVNIFNLIEQRDALFEEYLMIDVIIKKKDLSTEWDIE